LCCFVVGNSFTWDDWFRKESEDHSFQDVIDQLLNSVSPSVSGLTMLLTPIGYILVYRRDTPLGSLWGLLRYHSVEAGSAWLDGDGRSATPLGTRLGQSCCFLRVQTS
jgi:hypothetical protein